MHDIRSFGPLPAPPSHLRGRQCLLRPIPGHGSMHQALLLACPLVWWPAVPGAGTASLECRSWGACALQQGSRCQGAVLQWMLSSCKIRPMPSCDQQVQHAKPSSKDACPCCMEHLSSGIAAAERTDCVGFRSGWVWALDVLQRHYDCHPRRLSSPKFFHFLWWYFYQYDYSQAVNTADILQGYKTTEIHSFWCRSGV